MTLNEAFETYEDSDLHQIKYFHRTDLDGTVHERMEIQEATSGSTVRVFATDGVLTVLKTDLQFVPHCDPQAVFDRVDGFVDYLVEEML